MFLKYFKSSSQHLRETRFAAGKLLCLHAVTVGFPKTGIWESHDADDRLLRKGCAVWKAEMPSGGFRWMLAESVRPAPLPHTSG